jgi:hypothetical protein
MTVGASPSIEVYSVSATNRGFYKTLAVAAAGIDEAASAFSSHLQCPEDEGGDYVLGDDLVLRTPDEDGDRPNDGSMSLEIDRETSDRILSQPGRVVMLASGANG